jgi:hypothetical protein
VPPAAGPRGPADARRDGTRGGTEVFLLMRAPNYLTCYLPDGPADLWQRDTTRGAHELPQPPPRGL